MSERTGPAGGNDYERAIADAMTAHQEALQTALDKWKSQASAIAQAAALMIWSLREGGKVLAAGNGGSAADAQHFAAELVGRYKRERRPYPAIALTTDTSILTAIGNDYAFDEIFSRQVGALGREGDVFLAYSTSGESSNLLAGVGEARRQGMKVIAVTGHLENSLAREADIGLRMPATDTPVIQEMHLMTTHLLCDLVEAELAAGESAGA